MGAWEQSTRTWSSESQNQPSRRSVKTIMSTVRPRQYHCTLKRRDRKLRDLARRFIETELAISPPLLQNSLQPCFDYFEVMIECSLHGPRECLEFGGQHTAKAKVTCREHISVDTDKSTKPVGHRAAARVDDFQRLQKAVFVSRNQRSAQCFFGGEMIMQAGSRDFQHCGDIAIAERIVTPSLDQILGHIEDLLRCASFFVTRIQGDLPFCPAQYGQNTGYGKLTFTYI